MVVCDEASWNGIVGERIKKHFAQECYGMPQAEPIFDLNQVDFSSFHKLFKTHRNILMVDKINDKDEFKANLNVYAKGQLKITINKSWISSKSELELKLSEIISLFQNEEIKRMNSGFKKVLDHELVTKLKEKHKLFISIPKSFYLAKDTGNFVWYRNESKKKSQGILVYTFQPTGNDIEITEYMAIRDSITKKHIPGSIDGSYMRISNFLKPKTRTITSDGSLFIEFRGLWEVENDFMGGPFVSNIRTDSVNNRMVLIDGYVYSPNRKKRELLRQVEAICRSVRFLE